MQILSGEILRLMRVRRDLVWQKVWGGIESWASEKEGLGLFKAYGCIFWVFVLEMI